MGSVLADGETDSRTGGGVRLGRGGNRRALCGSARVTDSRSARNNSGRCVLTDAGRAAGEARDLGCAGPRLGRPDLGTSREFSRKVRTLERQLPTSAVGAMAVERQNPIRFEFISHKLLRLIIPLALAGLLVASFGLRGPFYRSDIGSARVFYALSALALSRLVRRGILRASRMPPALLSC